jgi:hypothetical protein
MTGKEVREMNKTKSRSELGAFVGRRLLFPLGQLVVTPGAIETLGQQGVNPFELLARHMSGDWGDLDDADKQENELSVQKGYRILSAYGRGTQRLWIITEADRSVTTILRPDEY